MSGLDAAQAAFDSATPEHLEEQTERGDDWCDLCGDQGVCPECVGT